MNLFDKIKNPEIKTERLLLNDIKISDKKDYFDLYTDDELNKYWGYDYREDLSTTPTQDYFYDFMQSLKTKKEEYSLAIRLDDKMIGEGVFHAFTENGEVEIGIRLFKRYHGKGFATESIKGMTEYLKKLNPYKIKAKCFIDNVKSKNAILRSGFTYTGQDNTYLYFEIVI